MQEALQNKPVDLAAAKVMFQKRWLLMQAILAKHTMAVNVAYVTWGAGIWGPLQQACGWTDPKTKATPAALKTVIESDENGRAIEGPALK